MTDDAQRDPRSVRDGESITTLAEAVRVFFSRRGPRTIAAAAATSWSLRALAGPPGPLDLAVAGAVVAWWPLQEWLAHKYLLHLPPMRVRGEVLEPLFARTHREHHEDPRDIDHTLLPLPVLRASIPAASAAFLVLVGPRRAALTGMATYSTMALFYEWTHFIVHTGVMPKSRYAKRVRQSHRLHHYRNDQYWFGFTAPFIDSVLGTDPAPASVPREHTVATPASATPC